MATSRGVKVHILADIWDWERAKFADALKKAGATVKDLSTEHDYYFVRDTSSMIEMGTDIHAQRIDYLDRSVRRLSENAIITTKELRIARAIRLFDEKWNDLNENDTDQVISNYLSAKCPFCSKIVSITFENSEIKLNKN